jgi:hypothetical protein
MARGKLTMKRCPNGKRRSCPKKAKKCTLKRLSAKAKTFKPKTKKALRVKAKTFSMKKGGKKKSCKLVGGKKPKKKGKKKPLSLYERIFGPSHSHDHKHKHKNKHKHKHKQGYVWRMRWCPRKET